MFLSFITVVTFEPAVFVANTPSPNPQIMADLGLIPARYMANIRNPLDRSRARSEIETTIIGRSAPSGEELIYSPVSTGVFAAEHVNTGEKYVKLEKGIKVQVHVIRLSNGKIVKVYIPLSDKKS